MIPYREIVWKVRLEIYLGSTPYNLQYIVPRFIRRRVFIIILSQGLFAVEHPTPTADRIMSFALRGLLCSILFRHRPRDVRGRGLL